MMNTIQSIGPRYYANNKPTFRKREALGGQSPQQAPLFAGNKLYKSGIIVCLLSAIGLIYSNRTASSDVRNNISGDFYQLKSLLASKKDSPLQSLPVFAQEMQEKQFLLLMGELESNAYKFNNGQKLTAFINALPQLSEEDKAITHKLMYTIKAEDSWDKSLDLYNSWADQVLAKHADTQTVEACKKAVKTVIQKAKTIDELQSYLILSLQVSLFVWMFNSGRRAEPQNTSPSKST